MIFFGKTFGAYYIYPYLCTIKNKQYNAKHHTTMKTLKFKSEKETAEKVIELTIQGKRFACTGRTTIVVFEN